LLSKTLFNIKIIMKKKHFISAKFVFLL